MVVSLKLVYYYNNMLLVFQKRFQGVFFIKRSENAVPRENIEKLVNFGDMTQAPLEHLSAVIDVINTILNNSSNNAKWPKGTL